MNYILFDFYSPFCFGCGYSLCWKEVPYMHPHVRCEMGRGKGKHMCSCGWVLGGKRFGFHSFWRSCFHGQAYISSLPLLGLWAGNNFLYGSCVLFNFPMGKGIWICTTTLPLLLLWQGRQYCPHALLLSSHFLPLNLFCSIFLPFGCNIVDWS